MKQIGTLLLIGATGLALIGVAAVVQTGRSQRMAVTSSPLPIPGVRIPSVSSTIELIDFLPSGFVTDGSVDYTLEVQRAIDSARGQTLTLPPFPVLVAVTPGNLWCLRITKPLEVRGCPGSVLRETKGGAIILYAESTTGVRFEGFRLQGNGKNGTGLAHGLLQVTWCKDVLVRDVRVDGSDADGIAVAASEDVRVLGCIANHCSKAALYMNGCTNALLEANLTRDSGGHVVPGGGVVGSAIQISSNKNLICSGNSLFGGIGVGILCNALQGGPKPEGCVVSGNRIRGFRNPSNMDVSGGIRCENANPERDTQTSLLSNSIRDCGYYGIFLEHHDGALIAQNTVAEIDWSGIMVSAANDVSIDGNVVLNVDTAMAPGKSSVHLINGASRTVVRGTRFTNSPAYSPGAIVSEVLDSSGGTGNDIEILNRHAQGAPVGGVWSSGSLTWNSDPKPGKPLGWVCVGPGSPGTWVPFGILR